MGGEDDAPDSPIGTAPAPPEWLFDSALPIVPVAAGVQLHRVYWSRSDAIFFGPPRGEPPTSRFDSASGSFGVLYLGESFAAAFVETLMRNAQRRMVRYADLALRSRCKVVAGRELRFVKLFDDGLATLGTDNAISTGPYGPCGLWSDALWMHHDRPDGIAYRSRYDSGLLCYALFERADLALQATDLEALGRLVDEVANLLRRYGKSLDWP